MEPATRTKQIKKKFSIIEFICYHPKIALISILAVTVFFAAQLPRVRVDNNNFRFIPKSNPARIISDEIEQKFGSDAIVIVGVRREFSDVTDKDFIEALRKLSDGLQAVPLVKPGSVVSLVTVPHIDTDGESIVSDMLVPRDYAGTPADMNLLKSKLRDWDLYARSLVSDDLRSTQILVFLDVSNEASGDAPSVEACENIKKITESWKCPDAATYITGLPVFNGVVNDATSHDLSLLVPLVVVAVLFVLFLSFRRFTGIFLPLATVIIATIWAIGAMPLFAVRMSILSTVLPVILVAVGSAYGIHVVSHYFDEVVQNNSISRDEHTAQIVVALKHISRPVLLAALTTFAGFVSFCFTSVVPIFEFGVFSSFGVLAAFFVAMTFIPAVLILRGPKKPVIKKRTTEFDTKWAKLDVGIANTLMLITDHKRTVVLLSLIIAFASMFGVSKIIFDNVLIEYFNDDTDISKSDKFIRDSFGGSKLLNVVVYSDEKRAVLRPDVLAAVDGLSSYLSANVPEVGKVSSFTDLIKRMNQVFNAASPPEGLASVQQAPTKKSAADDSDISAFGDFGADDENAKPSAPPARQALYSAKNYTAFDIASMLDAALYERNSAAMSADELVRALESKLNYRGRAYYEIPTDPAKYGKQTQEELHALIENYLFLLRGNTRGFLDDDNDPHALKINVQLKTKGQIDSDRVLRIIRDYIGAKFPPDVRVEAGGNIVIEKSLNQLVVSSQLISLAVSLAIVFLILAVYYRSLIAGIVGVVPLAISILINFGLMGLLKIKLNIGTAMVASFAIGIGIDYTIHYLAAYHSAWLQAENKDTVLRATFLGSGKAILFNAVSVGAGFAILAFSKFNVLAELGFLIAVTMLTSSVASLTLLPIILTIMKPRFITKRRKFDDE